MVNTLETVVTFPVLSDPERDAIVARARVKLFELLPEISEADWPALEVSLQIRFNLDPELNRLFWTNPERAIVTALDGYGEWARTNSTVRLLMGDDDAARV
jgi:hypothetical protein